MLGIFHIHPPRPRKNWIAPTCPPSEESSKTVARSAGADCVASCLRRRQTWWSPELTRCHSTRDRRLVPCSSHAAIDTMQTSAIAQPAWYGLSAPSTAAPSSRATAAQPNTLPMSNVPVSERPVQRHHARKDPMPKCTPPYRPRISVRAACDVVVLIRQSQRRRSGPPGTWSPRKG